MPFFNLAIQHGCTLEEARRGLEKAVAQVSGQFRQLIRRVEWSPDHHRVKLEGVGLWVEMWVDSDAVHVTSDIRILGGLLGRALTSSLKQIVQHTFQRSLP